MKVGWLIDDHGYVGGAEMTAGEFRAAAPSIVEIVDCPPGRIDLDCDVYVAHNAVQYTAGELTSLEDKRVVKYAHDLFLHDFHGSRDWFRANAEWIFCSPYQRDRMRLEGRCIPPALNLARLRPSRQMRRHTDRKGTVSIAQWRNPGKGPGLVAEYAREHGHVDVYGPGPFIPNGPGVNYLGELEPTKVAEVLASYEAFVFLPIDFEPFCRTVVEAHYAGCEVVTNQLIGARYWLEEDPEALETGGEDFWAEVLR